MPFIAVESFFDSICAAEIWPASIATNAAFRKQCLRRKELNDCLDDVVHCLPRPDMSLELAIKQGHITEEQAVRLYVSLSELLSDDDYRRLVLYLPFEFLPAKKWRPSREELRQASERFRCVYMKAWERMLSVHDVRANFVDGDVLEAEQQADTLPRVVKAAHLIPKLVEQGLMEAADALALMARSRDQILTDSIADTLPVLADMGFLPWKESERSERQSAATASRSFTLSSVAEKLNGESARIGTADFGNVTKNRAAWLRRKKMQEAVETAANDVSAAIMQGKLTDETGAIFLACDATPASQQALVEGIRKAIESLALVGQDEARALYARYESVLLSLWQKNDSEIWDALAKTFRRLRHLGVIGDEQLARLSIATPTLSGPFTENLQYIKEMRNIRKMAASIKTDPTLSRLIYPVVLVFGSLVSGYGDHGADIDLGVFVKPNTSLGDRLKLQELLQRMFFHQKIRGDEIQEFWLEEKGGLFKIRDFAEWDAAFGMSYWTHVLFGASWEGDADTIRSLWEKVLVPYMYDTDEIIQGRGARGLYIEDMEQAALQYRLMHKGYERFFPPCGGMHTPNADNIDGKSMFWDSGYRQLATRLFVSRVFLPKIPAPQK